MFTIIHNKIWYTKSTNLKISHNEGKKLLENAGEYDINIICLQPLRFRKNYLNISFNGRLVKGSGIELRFYNRARYLWATADLNAYTVLPKKAEGMKYLIMILRLKPYSAFYPSEIKLEYSDALDECFFDCLQEDTLIVTPSYPTEGNRYFGGFVHSRVREYQQHGIKFNLACIHEYSTISKYNFENIEILKGDFALLDEILHRKVFTKLLVHFFDEKYSKVLDRFDLTKTQIYFWIHGPETLYRDWNHFVTGYFLPVPEVSTSQEVIFKSKDKIIQHYNNMPNVHWVFVSNWIRTHSEALIGIKFHQYSVIPNIIDENIFNYAPKDPEQRKNIFLLRRFDNINKYAIDVNIRAIVALSRKPYFNDLNFYIYGEGNVYDNLILPIKNFPNVHFIKQFLTHKEISKVHKHYGIGLFATRYDAQGVSMCEAAMSGLVIVGSALDAIKEFIPEKYNTLCDAEDYLGLVNVIDRLYHNPDEFLQISNGMAQAIREHCCYTQTVQKEIDLITSPPTKIASPFERESPASSPLLTIIVPSYNVEKYIRGTIHSLTHHKRLNQIEIIIVNDGSTDKTAEIAKQLADTFSIGGKSLIRVINKENGGHGSTINVGIRKARGKYLKIVDGDDILESEELELLIEKLQTESSDAILCDYYNDILSSPELQLKRYYMFMTPGYQYHIDDLCLPIYGFHEFGPILATGTYKTSVMQNAGFLLSEKTFYVDMEFNAYVLQACETVSYYPLNVYRYRQGSTTQSISEQSYKKNYLQHERVLFNLIDFYEHAPLSNPKRDYIKRALIQPMISSQYHILTIYFQDPSKFVEFDNHLKEHDEMYALPVHSFVQKCRSSNGLCLYLSAIKRKVHNIL